jgi:hypothetical protein
MPKERPITQVQGFGLAKFDRRLEALACLIDQERAGKLLASRRPAALPTPTRSSPWR